MFTKELKQTVLNDVIHFMEESSWRYREDIDVMKEIEKEYKEYLQSKPNSL